MTDARGTRADDTFRDPPAEFRSLPFWAWNARLDNEEIATQIRSMKERGMGGFFMHSRDGLETPYMGEAWVDAVRTAIRTAEEEGLTAWLYDEDRWPSGSAGGKVPARGDAYRAKGLTLEILEGEYAPVEDAVAVFRARIQNLNCAESERLDPALPHGAQPGASFLVFRIEVAAPDEWFNGEAPPDNLNPDAVQAFLDLNYEPYRIAAGESFGRTVPGIFTDEPSVHDRHSRYTPGRGWIPWTYGFARYFAGRRGYDPVDDIPLVFFDGEGQSRIRHDYWRTITELFSESYTKRLGEWCAANGLAFTGHFLWENQMGTATRTGGAVMPHYRFQQVPGIDLLCEQIEETITVKQCTSVANQYGRSRVLCETYGCVGWEFSFEGQKWLGDWLFVMGVNVRCQHLALYSLKGCRKRDYPPVFNYNTSWWRHNKVVEDYFARLGTALTEGKPVRDILVLHPASTAWCRLGSNPRGFADRGQDRNLPEVNAYGDEYNCFLRALLGAHFDFDLGDETILSETGRAEGDTLIVNLATYRVAILPPIDSIFHTTLELLRSFLDGGGRLVAIAPRATMVEGQLSSELDSLHSHPNSILVEDFSTAIRAIDSLLARPVSLRNRFLVEDPEILCMYRVLDGNQAILFAVNTNREEGREILVRIEKSGDIEELDPLSGAIRPIDASFDASTSVGALSFRADFGPAGSHLYRIHFDTEPRSRSRETPTSFSLTPNFLVNPPILRAFGPTAPFERRSPNTLVLDTCSYDMEGHGWSAEMEVWRAQKEVRGFLGMRQVYYNGLAQRYTWTDEPHPRDGTPLNLRFRFRVADVPSGDVFLVLEEPGDFRISLNGAQVPADPHGWFLDKSFEKIRLPALVTGQNELILSCAYRNRMEIEDCFIMGDFAVNGERAIVSEPSELRFGDWCLQGYPHYCGGMVYRFETEAPVGRAVLRLGAFSAVTVQVSVNGHVAGDIPWRSADGLDLSSAFHRGKNLVEIELVGSPRNMLGPLHLGRGKVHFNEWSSFRPEGHEYTPGYVLHPYGLFGQVTLSGE